MPRLRVPVTDRDHVRGPARASVTLVEYGDFQCPFCGRAFYVLREIEQRLARDLRFVFRHFPIAEIHPFALGAAEAAEAAGVQGKFWEMHDTLYENQNELETDSLIAYAQQLRLDVDRFIDDLHSHRYLQHVRNDFMGGVRSGVNGTPCLFIGGQRYDGPVEETDLLRAIEMARSGGTFAELR
jgi:protein-disulfide isomerase